MGNCGSKDPKTKEQQPVAVSPKQEDEEKNKENTKTNNNDNIKVDGNDKDQKDQQPGTPLKMSQSTSSVKNGDTNQNSNSGVQEQESAEEPFESQGGAVTSPFRNRARQHIDDEQKQNQQNVNENDDDDDDARHQEQQKQKTSTSASNVRVFTEEDEFDQNPFGTSIKNSSSSVVVAPTAANFTFNLSPHQRNKSLETEVCDNTIIGGMSHTQVFPCFEGGLLYRLTGETVVQDENKRRKKNEKTGGSVLLPRSLRPQSWYFYNDTLDLDMKIDYSFGPTSKIEFGKDVVVVANDAEDQQVQHDENKQENQQEAGAGWKKCSLVVKPGETKLFITGIPNGYQSSYSSSINDKYFVVSPTSNDEESGNNKNSTAIVDGSNTPAKKNNNNKSQFLGDNKKDIESELEVVRGALAGKAVNSNNNKHNEETIHKFVEESVSRARNRQNNNKKDENKNEPFLSPTREYGENTFCLLPSGPSPARNNQSNNNNNEPIELSIRRALHQNQIKFVDLQFPPSDESLFRTDEDGEEDEDDNNNTNNKDNKIPSLTWARASIPHEGLAKLRTAENFNRSSVDPSNIDAGVLGDSWLTSALIALADSCPKLIEDRMFVKNHHDDDENNKETDMVQVSINKAGWWRDVLVDNFLPMALSRPAFARTRNHHSTTNNNNNQDPWVSFAQKAMAKVHGSYGALVGGDVLHALQDLTGFPTTNLNELWSDVTLLSSSSASTVAASSSIFEKEKYLFDRLSRSISQGNIVMLTTPGLDEEILEECIDEKFSKIHAEVSSGDVDSLISFYKKLGLGLGISYSLKHIYSDKNVTLLQFLNCSGNSDLVWSGAWSKSSDLWKTYPKAEKACRALSATSSSSDNNDSNKDDADYDNDPYFWMSWEDCKKFFSECGICYLQNQLQQSTTSSSSCASYETRVVGYFGKDEPRVPSVILEMKNKLSSTPIMNNNKNTKNKITATLSQIDSRGLRSDHPQAHGAAMLLSLFDNDEDEKGWNKLVANSTQDIEKQTTENFQYTFIRDISMTFNMQQNNNNNNNANPCYLIPRIHEKSRKQDTFYCLSIFSSEPLEIKFRSLKSECSVFQNAKAVSHEEWNKNLDDEDDSLSHVQYQVRNLKTGRIENF